VHTAFVAEDALVLTRVDDVIPHVTHRDQEVRDLVAGRRLLAVDGPRLRGSAAGAGSRDQGHRRVGAQVRDRERPRAPPAPPQEVRALDREAEVTSGERVRELDRAGLVEDDVAVVVESLERTGRFPRAYAELRGDAVARVDSPFMDELRVQPKPK